MHLDRRAIMRVIRLADRCAGQDLPGRSSGSLSQCSRELRQCLETLDHSTVLDIVALMWLGRDCRYWRKTPHKGQFDVYRERAQRAHPSAAGKADAIDCIVEKGPLSDYLREALQFIGEL